MVNFKNIIIWGHPLHTHTHSYIHEGFFKAFTYLGYNTSWMPDEPRKDLNFENSLFITESQSCKHIPVLQSCKYILHNCDGKQFESIPHESKLTLQVYVDSVLDYKIERVNDWTFWDNVGRGLFQCWATDLLPHEFMPLSAMSFRENRIYWIGTLGAGEFGNENEINGFVRGCNENNVGFEVLHRVENGIHACLINKSYIAPQLSGTWQKGQGYIPCRIFKNISYGQQGITNSKRVYEIFNGEIIYSDNEYELFYLAKDNILKQNFQKVSNFVKENHTYINRIEQILKCF